MKRIREENINTPEFFDEMWDRWDGGEWDTVRMDALAKHIKHGDTVVDLGCGWYSPAMWAALQGGIGHLDLRCVDFSPAALEKLWELAQEDWDGFRATGTALITMPANCQNVPLPDAIADVVIAGEIIEHMDDPAAFVAEQARLCKPGGWMTMSTVDPHCPDSEGLEYPEHVWEFEPDELLAMYAVHGEATYRKVGNYHFAECRKR